MAYDPPHVSAFKAGLKARCPHCGEGSLFTDYLTLAERCTACGLDYSGFDPGDGPAIFIMFVVGFIVVGGALAVEVAYEPPYWVHAAIWLPLVLILSLGLLRPFKATLVALQFKYKAKEHNAQKDLGGLND